MWVELSAGYGLVGCGGEAFSLFLLDGLAFLVSLIQDVIVNCACHSLFSIPAGAVAPSSPARFWARTSAFSLSLTVCPCLTALPVAGAFFPLAGPAIHGRHFGHDEVSVGDR